MSSAQPTGVILLVEDNASILDANRRILEKRGHTVLCAQNLAAARQLLKMQRPDLIVLDIMLPDGDGIDFFKEMRESYHELLGSVPVIFLTSKTQDEEILAGLEAGGNDYITKPYKIAEFCARVQTHLRWSLSKRTELPKVVTKGSITLNLLSRRALLNGADLELTGKDFDLLYLFIQNQGKLLSAEFIYEAVWARPMGEDENAVRTAIKRFRQKIQPAGYDVKASRGKGYIFNEERLL